MCVSFLKNPYNGRFQKTDSIFLIVELKLQNMIFKAHKNKAKSKRWALYLENWVSYDTFCVATWGENLYQTRFSNLKISVSFWDLGPIFCKWAQFLVRSNFYIATWGLTQLLHWFLRGGADLAPPPPIHGICTPSQVGLRKVKVTNKTWLNLIFLQSFDLLML